MTSLLFSPVTLGGITLPNRLAVAPMCQYSAVDGVPTDWHKIHLGSLGLGGAGLVVLEATAVSPEGRISADDLGLWNDTQERAFADLRASLAQWTTTPAYGIQIAHAGRKASTPAPWLGAKPVLPDQPRGWRAVGPSDAAFDPDFAAPEALDAAGLIRIRDAFVATARRAARAGYEAVEVHAAHGYLLHEFLSPLVNHRTDGYGGSLENRMRFPLDVARAVRDVWPADRILGIRVSATDWADGGLTLEETVIFLKEIKKIGYDYVCVSSGGAAPGIAIPVAANYQVPLAATIKRETGLPTRAVGMIVGAHQAESILAEGQADLIAVARGFLENPRWGVHAAETLGVAPDYAKQYRRATPATWPGYALKD